MTKTIEQNNECFFRLMRIKLFLEQAFLLHKNLMAQDGSWKKNYRN